MNDEIVPSEKAMVAEIKRLRTVNLKQEAQLAGYKKQFLLLKRQIVRSRINTLRTTVRSIRKYIFYSE